MKTLPSRSTNFAVSRRQLIRKSLSYYSSLLLTPLVVSCGETNNKTKTRSNLSNLGPLLEADSNGCKLPKGFTSRIVAQSSTPVVSGSSFHWHSAPDGGACFLDDGGWIYVSNSEASVTGHGGASAIKFDASGYIVDAYPVLAGTTRNCAGGITPYNTWLSCEESGDHGKVYECDPWGIQEAIERPSLGCFNHEAVAYDEDNHILYMTEDRPDGGLYRFIPNELNEQGYADLRSGQLQIADVVTVDSGYKLLWHDVPDPLGLSTPTRYQVPESSSFDGGEGITYFNGIIAFTTKGDSRVWQYHVSDHTIEVLYDDGTSENPILTNVDNITVNFSGDYLVAEDGGDMQIVVLTTNNKVLPLLALEGHDHSEITGPAFSPDGSRLYFSSQRGVTGHSSDGVTFEISGPFFTDR